MTPAFRTCIPALLLALTGILGSGAACSGRRSRPPMLPPSYEEPDTEIVDSGVSGKAGEADATPLGEASMGGLSSAPTGPSS